MATRFSSARHQAVLGQATGYRRRSRLTFSRNGVSATVEPIAGSITQDARRSGRWDGRITIADSSLIPELPGDLLTPFGTTVTVEVGLELLDGSVEYLPYGKFSLSRSSADIRADQQTTDISLIDLSDRIERYRFETPFSISAGTTLSQMITNVVYSRLGVVPGVTTVPILLTANQVFGLETSNGPWSELLDVLDAHSVTAWYNRSGQIKTGSTLPNTSGSYPLPALTSVSVDFDSGPANVIVVRGETTSNAPPVQAVVMDTDPGSPTYAGEGPGTSPYGRTTKFYSSPLIITEAQAESAGESLLAENLGAGAAYTMTHPFNPTTDANDLVSWNGSSYVVDSITLDLLGETSAQLRKVA